MPKISDIQSGIERFNREEFLKHLPNGDGKRFILESINDIYKNRRKVKNKWTNINDDIKAELVNKLILKLMKVICEDED